MLGLDRAPEVKRCGANWRVWPPPDGPPSSARPWLSNGSRCAERPWVSSTPTAMCGFITASTPCPRPTWPVCIALPATSDYWVNDSAGDPLFVVTAEANAGLVKMLPGILGEVRALVGERRVTVVFDRGGYSPKLFQHTPGRLRPAHLSQGAYPRIPRLRFQARRTRAVDGPSLSLADQEVRLLKGKFRLRQVTRLMDNGHQTPILTSRRDLPAAQVAYRMFELAARKFLQILEGRIRLGCAGPIRGRPGQPHPRSPQPGPGRSPRNSAKPTPTLTAPAETVGRR